MWISPATSPSRSRWSKSAVVDIRLVSAFSTELGLVLGQEKVVGKSNVITAIPELLEAVCIKGLLVGIGGLGSQREIAAKIVDKGGDYLLAVKGNQPTLHQQVCDLISDAQLANDGFKHVDKSHGRTVMQLSYYQTSLRLKRKPAAWDDDIRMQMLGIHPL